MVMYVDFIFLLNFVIDAVLLYIVAWTLKLKVGRLRIAAAAAIGAAYVVLIFFPAASFLFTFVVKLLISVFMVWIAFGFRSLQYFIRCIGAFYLVHFIAAGGIFAIHHSLRSSHDVVNGILFTQSGGSETQIGLIFLGLVLGAVLLFYKHTHRSLLRTKQLQQYIVEVHVYLGSDCSVCKGLVDTGNQLTDPLTRRPVMIMEAQVWEHILPASLTEGLKTSDTLNLLDQFESDEAAAWQDRVRLVPYRSVNRDSQFMFAIKPDKVIVFYQSVPYETDQVLIGLEGGKLSSDRSYRAIIHPHLVGQIT